jgi:hypothetical protein
VIFKGPTGAFCGVSAAFLRWHCGGANWNAMPFSSIRDWGADDASLSSHWRSSLNPRDSKKVTACLYAVIMEGPLRSNMGPAWMKLPLYSYTTRMYWLPDVLGIRNLPVGLVNIMVVVA